MTLTVLPSGFTGEDSGGRSSRSHPALDAPNDLRYEVFFDSSFLFLFVWECKCSEVDRRDGHLGKKSNEGQDLGGALRLQASTLRNPEVDGQKQLWPHAAFEQIGCNKARQSASAFMPHSTREKCRDKLCDTRRLHLINAERIDHR